MKKRNTACCGNRGVKSLKFSFLATAEADAISLSIIPLPHLWGRGWGEGKKSSPAKAELLFFSLEYQTACSSI
jgi:hypothetical protein